MHIPVSEPSKVTIRIEGLDGAALVAARVLPADVAE